MKKKVFAVIILLLLAAGIWALVFKPSFLKLDQMPVIIDDIVEEIAPNYFSKPDQMQVIVDGEVTEIAPEEDAFDQIYKMMNEAWETSTMHRGQPMMIMFTHLDEEILAEASEEIRFIYEEDIEMDKESKRVKGNTLSFFPFDLECAAFSRDANYRSNAVVYVFSLSEEQKAEWNALMQ